MAKEGAKNGDRVRAAIALLDYACRGSADLGELRLDDGDGTPKPVTGTGDVVNILAERLRRIDAAELPTAEKSRLTATLADSIIRAISADVIDKRLEALQAVLSDRKEKK
ncbi:MAG: hypothetical protein ACR2K5_04325 [Pseudolabrys sp.]